MSPAPNRQRVRAGVSVLRYPNGDVDLEFWPLDAAPVPDRKPDRVERFTQREWVDMMTYASKIGVEHSATNVELVRIELAKIHGGTEEE